MLSLLPRPFVWTACVLERCREDALVALALAEYRRRRNARRAAR
jgi:hypothetical protein